MFLRNNNTPEIEIYVKYNVYTQSMTAAALIKTTISIEEWLAATTFVKQRNIIHKMFFLGTTTLDYSLFL